MTVGELLTNIANKIRSLLDLADKMTLEKMASSLQEVNDEVKYQEELLSQILAVLEEKKK